MGNQHSNFSPRDFERTFNRRNLRQQSKHPDHIVFKIDDLPYTTMNINIELNLN